MQRSTIRYLSTFLGFKISERVKKKKGPYPLSSTKREKEVIYGCNSSFFSDEEYIMPFEDVGEITKVKVRLVEEGQRCPSDTRKKKKKRFFSFAGYTLGNVSS